MIETKWGEGPTSGLRRIIQRSGLLRISRCDQEVRPKHDRLAAGPRFGAVERSVGRGEQAVAASQSIILHSDADACGQGDHAIAKPHWTSNVACDLLCPVLRGHSIDPLEKEHELIASKARGKVTRSHCGDMT